MVTVLFFKDFIYLFFRGEGREKERERNIDVREKHHLAASHTGPSQVWIPQPRHLPGIKLVTFHFAEQCSANGVTTVRANCDDSCSSIICYTILISYFLCIPSLCNNILCFMYFYFKLMYVHSFKKLRTRLIIPFSMFKRNNFQLSWFVLHLYPYL